TIFSAKRKDTIEIAIKSLYKTLGCAICSIINKVVYETEVSYERTIKDNSELKNLKEPVVDKICEKCGHDQMSYTCRQTRSADEGQTVFYTCLKCKHSIEYS
ncbi:unnamed protein product, partial [Anisakis simplex]|uniref:DNA-directed RNA polymerase I subunit RPA12 n=1 Tax=Anisakis simplex TaxID=6269 RepID=A0A0M3J1S9_ANISI